MKYLVYNTSKAQNLLLSVSSVNVMMYAVVAGGKCESPESMCYDYKGNSHKPIVIESYTG